MIKIFKRDNIFIFLSIVFLLIVILSLLSPLISKITGLNPEDIDLANRFLNPSISHPMGTDDLGRDIFIRILYGGRISIIFGTVLTLASLFIGVILGLFSGYYRGLIDFSIMRLTDALFSLPILPVLIVFSAIDLNKIITLEGFDIGTTSIIKIFTVILFFSWMSSTRILRSRVIEIKSLQYIEAAKIQGAGDLRIIFRHILPNSLGSVTSICAVTLSTTILYESTLSFLGLGIRPPTPSWGNMIASSIEFMHSSPFMAVFPGLMLFISILSLNGIAEGIRKHYT